jgi:peroxiredoxin
VSQKFDFTPQFSLPDTDGSRHSLPKGKPAVVFFTSNVCPFALAWHQRLLDVARDYQPRGVSFFAINSNDPDASPEDTLDLMRERYAVEDWMSVPYLWDETQEVAVGYGAQRTPDVFVLDAAHRLRYRGIPDEDCEDESLQAGLLRDALDAVLTGHDVAPRPAIAVGCPIKWRGRPAHPPGVRPPTGVNL